MGRWLAVVLATLAGAGVGQWVVLPLIGGYGIALDRRTQQEIVGLVTVLWFLAGLRFGDEWDLIPVAILIASLVAASAVDLALYRLPDQITLPTLAICLASILTIALARDDSGALGRAALGMGLYFGVLLVFHLVSPAGLGFGDVKLALPMGLMLGWLSASLFGALNAVLVGLLIGSALGAMGGVTLLVIRRRTGRVVLPDPENSQSNVFPFGPALATATVIVMLVLGPPPIG